MDLLVLGHVRLAAEVIEVAGVGLGIELGNEGRLLLPKTREVDLSKVLVLVDLGDVLESVLLSSNQPGDQIPCPLAEEIVRIIILGACAGHAAIVSDSAMSHRRLHQRKEGSQREPQKACSQETSSRQ